MAKRAAERAGKRCADGARGQARHIARGVTMNKVWLGERMEAPAFPAQERGCIMPPALL
ncbi:hypothetical protein [Azospirillum argentinense]